VAEKSWTTRDRSEWGSGPWDGEPDKVSWTDEATGRPCLGVRNGMGAWCGYVAVDPGHLLHGEDYDMASEMLDIDVHGGLTFADRCQEGRPESEGICHVPQPGQPHDVWWFGFDTAHAGDLVPSMARYEAAWGLGNRVDIYRDLAYVQAECASLAKQLAS
jgi:hypothetical protein